MVSINYATREVSCKIVYYGPGLSGKTTNLQYVHQKVPSNTKGKLISLATDADRTLYFDFLPINIGTINGFAAKFQLYTVPGQVYYNATRKLVLRGVDGLVFVADSQPDKMDENIESLNNLKENLAEYGYSLDEVPLVIQYNKQDLTDVMAPEQMRPVLNPHSWPEFSASATEGFGVFDTLKCILKLVLDKAKTGGTAPKTGTPAPPQANAPVSPTPPEAPVPAAERTPLREQAVEPERAVSPEVPSRPEPADEDVTVSPVREPVMQMAGTSRMADNEPKAKPPMPPTEQPETYQREEVTPDTSEPEVSRPAYRPFPGNTFEDEQMMMRPPEAPLPKQNETVKADAISDDIPSLATVTDDQTGTEDKEEEKEPTATPPPRMAPSLKADKPRKKRSFFKRLFGLK
jgi:signal recognition particle receptor subunit beta